MRKYAVALTFLLVVSGCGGSSDTATPATTVNPAATQAPTTTAVPTTTVAATTTTTAVLTTTAVPTTTQPERPLLTLANTVQVTPDPALNLTGAFCRIHHVTGRNGFIVTFGGAARSGLTDQGHGYKAYDLDLVPTGEMGTFYPYGGDAASVVVDDVFYFATGSPEGWRLLKFDGATFDQLGAVDYPIDLDRQLENDNLLAFVGGLLDASGLHVEEGSAAHREGTPQDGPLESRLIDHDRGYATHHRLFTTDLEFVGEMVLDDAPQFFGTSLVEVGGTINLVTSSAFLSDLVVIRYDGDWNHLDTLPLGLSGTWPQGLIYDEVSERLYLAYEAGIRGLRNVRIAVFDREWNLLDDFAVTDFSWEDEKVASRPWLSLVDASLHVSYDVVSVVGPRRDSVLNNECIVQTYR
jgi:hypothetical protein